ncbi:uncharacterized protein LOC120211129 [Hibiscus syriacus]|uniref:uncharacterized protein LOC120211129 n=1 Tax=Hibiscus syriacus TaxID=106335 RepID=UPI001924FB14|nr:uncharacterized protein LOC120211129 [Hibiscus syriacus]
MALPQPSPPSSSMAAPPSPPSKIGLWTILSESNRILRAQPRNLQALLLLFLLPSSFLLSLYPFIAKLFYPTIESHLSSLQQNPSIKPFILNLVYSLIISVFSNFSFGSITYSVFHGFHGQPVKPSSAIKAAFTSFFPLLSTSFVQSLIISGIGLILGLVFFALFMAIQVLGFQVIYSPSYVIILAFACMIIFTSVLFYLQVNWIFAFVIVVVESSWGLEPLKRSRILVKGIKGVALKILLFFGLCSSINVLRSIMQSGDSASDEYWKSWDFIWNIVGTTSFYMLILIYNLAAYTVFYAYSKAEEFAGDYASLPFADDGKVPHVVSIV